MQKGDEMCTISLPEPVLASSSTPSALGQPTREPPTGYAGSGCESHGPALVSRDPALSCCLWVPGLLMLGLDKGCFLTL